MTNNVGMIEEEVLLRGPGLCCAILAHFAFGLQEFVDPSVRVSLICFRFRFMAVERVNYSIDIRYF